MSESSISKQLLSSAVNDTVTGIVISDFTLPDMPLIYVNPAFEELTGYTSEDILGKNCRFLQGPETDQKEIDKIRAAIKHEESCTVTLLNYKKDGTPFWSELSISPVKDSNNKLTHFIGIQKDVTSKIQAIQDLIKAKEKAEEATLHKTNFLNTISHELRTPLTVMLGNIPLLTDIDDIPDSEEIVEIAKDIEESGKYLLQLINELLDISRIEQNRLPLFPIPVNIKEITEDAVHTLNKLAQEKGIELKSEIEDFTLVIDPIRLKQILFNLIGNAVKFTDQGSVKVHVFPQNDRGFIKIIDTGAGIRPEFLPSLFEVFRQENSTATRSKSGSGLGLAITKKLVDLQNGEILVESVHLKGSTFTLIFPI